MMVDYEKWTFAGTSRLNATGATGTGTATIPKTVAEKFYDQEGSADMVVFEMDRKIMLVPREEVNIEP